MAKALTEIQARSLLEYAAALRAALHELVDLKTLKDAHGKTPEYERRQPLAWQQAREALGET